MRVELELIEQIEHYILGQMSGEERMKFEAEMNVNSDLKQKVEVQQFIVEGIRRLGLKADASKAYKQWRLRKWLFRLGLPLILLLSASFTYMYWPESSEEACPCFIESASDSTFEEAVTAKPECCEGNLSTHSQHEEQESETIDVGNPNTPILEEEISDSISVQSSDSESHLIDENGNTANEGGPSFYSLDKEPSFPGGEAEMFTFLNKTAQYPEVALSKQIQGTVYVSFFVNRDGKLSDFSIYKGVHKSLDQEAIRVMKLMPKWEPAIANGQPVKAQYTVPISFSLE